MNLNVSTFDWSEEKHDDVREVMERALAIPEDRWLQEHREAWRPRRKRPARSRMKAPPNGFPKVDGLAYLYVVEFSTGAVKVGWSADPAQRWRTYQYDASALDVSITRMWISQAHRNVRRSEKELINFCAARGWRNRAEYFSGIAFGDVAAYAEKLPDWADTEVTEHAEPSAQEKLTEVVAEHFPHMIAATSEEDQA